MRILFVNRMMGVSWGGGENYDYHLARALQERGHDVLMLTGRRRGANGRKQAMAAGRSSRRTGGAPRLVQRLPQAEPHPSVLGARSAEPIGARGHRPRQRPDP